ncbi:MAG: hypothetical protein PHZ04_00480 [Patescibacteria group bacterium]|nr:hypothetical protein [Patescibacteria group bacterium]MDD5294763.1 hypothetical protein [Patescibacteria group bacterium]MDD5554758.1 hypothetical protein [Patescibacteria group bacterium]
MKKISWKWLAGIISAITLTAFIVRWAMKFYDRGETNEDVTWVG